MRQPITADALRAAFQYNATTGVLTNRVDRSANAKAGAVAGYVHSDGAIYINFIGRMLKAHRIVWWMVHGREPSLIDHINGVRTDNRLCNLREVTRRVNAQNKRPENPNNRFGLLGVEKHGPSFRCCIVVDGRKTRRGGFATPEEAHREYVRLKRRLHEGCTI